MLKCALGGKAFFFFWGSWGLKRDRNFSFNRFQAFSYFVGWHCFPSFFKNKPWNERPIFLSEILD